MCMSMSMCVLVQLDLVLLKLESYFIVERNEEKERKEGRKKIEQPLHFSNSYSLFTYLLTIYLHFFLSFYFSLRQSKLFMFVRQGKPPRSNRIRYKPRKTMETTKLNADLSHLYCATFVACLLACLLTYLVVYFRLMVKRMISSLDILASGFITLYR